MDLQRSLGSDTARDVRLNDQIALIIYHSRLNYSHLETMGGRAGVTREMLEALNLKKK